MRLFELTERINDIHRLIIKQSTGDPECFASKLGIRKRQLFNILEDLRLMGAPICYDANRRTYYYSKDYLLHVEVKMEVLGNDSLNNVNGGFCFAECNFIALDPDKFALESIGQLAYKNKKIINHLNF